MKIHNQNFYISHLSVKVIENKLHVWAHQFGEPMKVKKYCTDSIKLLKYHMTLFRSKNTRCSKSPVRTMFLFVLFHWESGIYIMSMGVSLLHTSFSLVILSLIQNKTAHRQQWLLPWTICCFSVYVKIGDFLNKPVISWGITTRNHPMYIGDVMLILYCYKLYTYFTSMALPARMPSFSTVEILNYFFNMI